MSQDEIVGAVRDYILSRFLEGEDPSLLTTTTPLVSSGVLDSLARMDVVAFLEDRYKVEFGVHEVDAERLETLASIAELVQGKLAPARRA